MPGFPSLEGAPFTGTTPHDASIPMNRSPSTDQRVYAEELLHALGEWWDEVGFATRPEDATYAPKYQVICKETVQKLLYSWLQRREVRGVYPMITSLSYQEFASKLGEPALWQKWWNVKVAPVSGVPWGPRGQWCRLYRLHNALPPFVRLRTLSAEDAAGVRPTSDRSPWLVDQLKVLRALEDYWEDVGVVLAPSSRMDDGSFIGGDIDESFLQGGADAEKNGTVPALDISAIEPNVDQSAIHDVSVDDINGLDTSQLNAEYWSEQLTNHRDLVQGLHAWIHSDPSRQRMYRSAASIDKYTFRAHLNQVWSFWWASKIEPKCGVAWGSCGRFNRRLRLPPYVRMKEHANEACPVDFSEIHEPSQLGNVSFSAANTSSLDSHRGMVRGALLDAFRDWWSSAGVVMRPEEMGDAIKRDQISSDYNVSKQKIQLLLYKWLRYPAAQAAHPVAATVKFRALSSMLGYLWGRWWDSCVAPLAGIRWGGSGRFSNKGVLPSFVRLREPFVSTDKEVRVSMCDVDVESDAEDVEPTVLEDDSFWAGYKPTLHDLSASDLLMNNSGSWASASFYRERPKPPTRGSSLRREFNSSPLSALSGDCFNAAPFSTTCDDVNGQTAPLSSPTSVLDISHDSKYLHPGLLEVLDGMDSEQEDEYADDPTLETPTTHWDAANENETTGAFVAYSPPVTNKTGKQDTNTSSGMDGAWDPSAWGAGGTGLKNVLSASNPFSSDPIHTIPVDAPAVSTPLSSTSGGGQTAGGLRNYQLWESAGSSPKVDRPFVFPHKKSTTPDSSSSAVGTAPNKAPGSPTRGTQPQSPGSGMPMPYQQQQVSISAVLQQQAAMLADLIAARAVTYGSAEHIAQLNMMQQMLFGVVGNSTLPSCTRGLWASNPGLAVGHNAGQLGMPMPNATSFDPSRSGHSPQQPLSAALMAAVGLPNFPSSLM